MKLLVVGSVALDSIHTPFGEVTDALGGSAVYFSTAASLLTQVRVVGVVGSDYPMAELEKLAARGVEFTEPIANHGYGLKCLETQLRVRILIIDTLQIR